MKIDLDFLNALGEQGIPFALAFTKSDRLGKVKAEQNIQTFLAEMSKSWETLPPYFVTSSEYRTGKEDLLGYIGDILKNA